MSEDGDGRGNLVMLLHALQEEHGFLDEPALRALARRERIPLAEIEAVSSFYPHFRREPPPSLQVEVCRDVVCRLRGGAALRDAMSAACREGRSEGVALTEGSCPGLCDRAPVVRVQEEWVEPSAAAAWIRTGHRPTALHASDDAADFALDPYDGRDAHYGVLREWLADFDPQRLTDRLTASGLRGMGGAGFPTGRKWAFVRDEAAQPHELVCNADESEPGTFKDRVILEALPHLVIEGIVLGGLTVGARRGWVYLRHEYAEPRRRLRAAIDDAYARGVLGPDVCGSGRSFDLDIFVSPGGYILGEETALLEAMEGRRGEPRNKPPYPGVVGLYGRPTVINNVETFAQVPRALQTGTAELKIFALSGDVERPGVVEAPLGTPLRALVDRCGGVRGGGEIQAFLPGGSSTRFLPGRLQDVAMDWDSLSEAGSSLGTGAVVVVGQGADLLALARNITAFFRNESCGKCVPCRLGTEQALGLLASPGPREQALLRQLDEVLRETSLCGLGQVALSAALSVLPEEGA